MRGEVLHMERGERDKELFFSRVTYVDNQHKDKRLQS